MQRSVASESTVSPADRSRSAQLAPTSVDRLLDRAQHVAPQLSRASDAILIGTAALLAVVDLVVWATDPVIDTGRLSVSIAVLVPCLGALATIALACRRRHLTGALTTLAGSSILLTFVSWIIGTSLPPSFAALFALAVMTSVAMRRESSSTAIALALLSALAVAAESLRPLVSAAGYLLFLCEGALAIAVGVGVYLRWSDWRRVAAADAARADERLDIAREVHDMVGHYVTAMVVQAQAARHVADHHPAAASTALENIEVAGHDALAAMHRMVGDLRDDSPTAPTGTWDDVEQLIADAVAQGMPVHLSVDDTVRVTARALVPSVHRIVGESLTNVRRHAHGVTHVDVVVARNGDVLVTTIHDDGVASDHVGRETFGIVGMRERAASLGGSLSAGPSPEGGWTVRAELPIALPR